MSSPEQHQDRYEPPTIVVLGTLAELTLGSGTGTDDGLNGLNGDASVIH